MTILPITFLRLGAAATCLAGVSLHGQSAEEQSAHLSVRLQVSNVGAATTRAALRIRVAPGWHIGDRAPGDTGLPTRITWILPEGWRVTKETWPTPATQTDRNGTARTHSGEVTVISEISRSQKRSGKIEATVKAGVCRDVCIPETVRLSAVVR
jgi:DsbC/DsbD-like thiol-disulfide interchange protein